jgi:hypothetical protein
MNRRIALFLMILMLTSLGASAKDKEVKAPSDFKLVYRSSAGQLEQATKEQVEVSAGNVTVTRRAKPIGAAAMTDASRSYKIDQAQLDALWAIIQESGFLQWPKNPEGPHASQVEESFDITANGKTVSHGRWEQGLREKFRILFEKYNSWFNGIRTVRF